MDNRVFIIEGDLLDQEGYLMQQCNCVTVKAHGLSQVFIDRFGEKADLYGKRSKRSTNYAKEPSTPGSYEVVVLNDKQTMVGLYGQWLPGKSGSWSRSYNYKVNHGDSSLNRINYFNEALQKFLKDFKGTTPVFFPYRIGCGLAGGDWSVYEKMIDDFANLYKGNVYIVKLKNEN